MIIDRRSLSIISSRLLLSLPPSLVVTSCGCTTLEIAVVNRRRFTMVINFNPKALRVCFSYAAYTKNLIDYLKSCNIPIEQGLTDVEFSSIESILNFKFPPDLLSLLQEGLPVGPGFPNWRSTSIQQLQILTNLPILSLCKEISRNNFWLDSWGERPLDNDQAVNLARGFLKNVPVLVPLYRNFYIPSLPCLAGNPVFYVHGGDIKLWSFDIAGFFHQVELKVNEDVLKRPTLSNMLNVPAWAATEPRRIEFWTLLVDRGEKLAAGGGGGGRCWWSGNSFGGCLDEVIWRLRNGGWKEEDVREMMIMDGCDDFFNDDNKRNGSSHRSFLVLDKEDIAWRVKVMSKRLLRAGWSMEDVKESLGFSEDCPSDPADSPAADSPADDQVSWYDCQQSMISSKCHDIEEDHTEATNELVSMAIEMMNMHSIKMYNI